MTTLLPINISLLVIVFASMAILCIILQPSKMETYVGVGRYRDNQLYIPSDEPHSMYHYAPFNRPFRYIHKYPFKDSS